MPSLTARFGSCLPLEAAIVMDNLPLSRADRRLDALIQRSGIVVEPVTEVQVGIARQANASFGRGNHPAALNFGDCFAYALSKDKGKPLLFKGDDFKQTDIAAAVG
jgi:ribonuclease VapC